MLCQVCIRFLTCTHQCTVTGGSSLSYCSRTKYAHSHRRELSFSCCPLTNYVLLVCLRSILMFYAHHTVAYPRFITIHSPRSRTSGPRFLQPSVPGGGRQLHQGSHRHTFLHPLAIPRRSLSSKPVVTCITDTPESDLLVTEACWNRRTLSSWDCKGNLCTLVYGIRLPL